MSGWIWLLISFVVVVLATRGRRGVQAMGHGHRNRIGGHRKPAPDKQPQTADDSTTDIHKDPCLENSSVYQGEIYFFCSIEDRDTFTATLDQFGEYHPSETSNIPRAIERRN